MLAIPLITSRVSVLVLALSLFACQPDRLIRKSIDVGDCRFEWYFYSHIGNFSSERITIRKGDGEELLVFESEQVATNFEVRSDSLIIHIYAPAKAAIIGVADTTVYGYKVLLDTTATVEDFRKRSDWHKE
ncbi:MAG: hypothetical protein KA175_14170 [Flavobacteriales bacterium]|nr:hypothetical protein [Flavobacteriales bacterium]MBP6698761.1 hypothetical protein [Flavobacteriales bacterium]